MKAAPLVILLLLAGCSAVGPDYVPPEAPEVAQELFAGEGAETDSLARWWEDFHDPVLTELIDQGLKSAPTVEAAIARLRAQRAAREGTEAGFWPQFTADGNYTWGRKWGANRSGWADSLGASANASWELDVFGGVRRSVERAIAEEARLAYNLQEVRVSLAAEIATAYVNLRRYAAQVDIAEANLALQERNAATIRARFEAGEVARYDLVAAEAQMAATRASIPALQQNLTSSQLELDWLTGQAPYATRVRLQETLDTMALPDLSPKLLPNELLRRRADIRMAEEDVHAQTAAIGIAEAEIYPRFALGGTLGITSPSFAPWSDYTQSASFGPSASWNIFGFGTWRKQVESAKETLKAVLADYRDTVLDAYREAESAWVACQREAERSTDLRTAEQNHALALEIANKRYELGDISIDDVLTRQSSLLSAQENLVTHRATLFTNAITLYRTLGGGWSDEPRETPGADGGDPAATPAPDVAAAAPDKAIAATDTPPPETPVTEAP